MPKIFHHRFAAVPLHTTEGGRGFAAIVTVYTRKNALRFWRAAGCRPYGNDREIGAENAKFLRGKTYIKSKFYIT